MAYKISDACIACGACAELCPDAANKNAGSKYEIDEATCVECGACAAQCPVEAIKG